MYLEYYTLDRPPFRITPDPSLFYTGGENGRGVVLEALLYAVTSGEGILKVVGEVGSGKTMLCRMLEQRLPDTVEVVYLANPNLAPHEILYAIAFELKLPVDHTTQRLILMQHLQEYLLKQHAANRTVLVIIEEAQSMPIETLEEVRLFSNLETHQHKLMQIVMFGQPELDKNLQDKSIRQLRERITHSFDLRPLNEAEVSDYIRFRLQAAGCPAPQVFSSAAEKMIAKASCGLTRRINILADKAMLAAYAESATGQRPRTVDNFLQPAVLPKHVKAAIIDSGYETSVITWPKAVFASVVVLFVLVIAGWWYFSAQNSSSTALAAHVTESNLKLGSGEHALVDVSVANASSFTITVPITTESGVQEVVESPSYAAVLDQEPLLVVQRVMPEKSTNDEFAAMPPLLRERSEETQRWLKQADSESYTLQLMSVSSAESDYVAYVLGRLEQGGLARNTYTCVFGNDDQQYWKMVYGEFATTAEARAVIRELPAIVRNNGPFVQRIQRLDCNE